MTKFTNTHEMGMTSPDDLRRRFKGGGGSSESTTSQEPPAHLQGAYKQYGQALTGTPGTPGTSGYWTGGSGAGGQRLNPEWEPGSLLQPQYFNSGAGGQGKWVPGTPGTPGSGGFMQEYNPEWYQGRTQARIPQWMKGAMEDYRNTATDKKSGLNQAEKYNRQVMKGKYLGLSDSMRQAVMNPAMDATAARFAQMGRYGSDASQEGMNRAGMAAAMPYYNAERQRQGQAAQNLPLFEQEAFNRQNQVGTYEMGRQQQRLNEQRQEFEFNQNKYYDKMSKYGQLLSPGSQYGITTNTQPGGSTAAGIAGGALSGAAAGSMFGVPGAAIGGVLGGIGGAL